jgi:hypothetical protein
MGGGGLTHAKDFKNTIKHENIDNFFSQPQVPPSKEFDNECSPVDLLGAFLGRYGRPVLLSLRYLVMQLYLCRLL